MATSTAERRSRLVANVLNKFSKRLPPDSTIALTSKRFRSVASPVGGKMLAMRAIARVRRDGVVPAEFHIEAEESGRWAAEKI